MHAEPWKLYSVQGWKAREYTSLLGGCAGKRSLPKVADHSVRRCEAVARGLFLTVESRELQPASQLARAKKYAQPRRAQALKSFSQSSPQRHFLKLLLLARLHYSLSLSLPRVIRSQWARPRDTLTLLSATLLSFQTALAIKRKRAKYIQIAS